MVAGARLNRAQQRILAMRPYAVKTGEIVQSVAASMAKPDGAEEGAEAPPHPLLARRPESNVLFIVLTGDRGLCGAFNSNICKATEREWREKLAKGASVGFATLGKKGRDYFTRRGAKIVRDFPRIYDGLDLGTGRMVSAWMVGHFLKADFDSVYLVYNEFKSAMTQRVTLERLLPLPELAQKENAGGGSSFQRRDDGTGPAREFLYEPNKDALLERLVPMYVEISIYRAMLESQAGFFGAQMTAMDAATRNAKERISRLTLAYNRARQAAITKELMEIIGGAEALKE
jgi:F-type H+-transporting ATPase subunit gamma